MEERDIKIKIVYNVTGILTWAVFLMFFGEVMGLFSTQMLKEPVLMNKAFYICIVSYFVIVGLIMWFRNRRYREKQS
ncbi:MAG: hypothetical protein HY999_01655 [Nitrospinae bacterium]|nr:hypothetical protein [Nitrospinota bacterium]